MVENDKVERTRYRVGPYMIDQRSKVPNPTWSRDELILALDLYVRYKGNPPGKAAPEVLELSSLLNSLARGANSDFRNANGVYMKVMNFRRFDPIFVAQGKFGLQRGGLDEAIVWQIFANDVDRLTTTSKAIKANAGLPANDSFSADDLDAGLQEAEEGRLLTAQHVRRERSRKLIEAKKKSVVAAGGTLTCEACLFDYEKVYGERGKGFIEVHHTKPVHSLLPGATTHVRDLALVCANCHRMIHARSQWMTMEQLRVALRTSAR